MHALDARNGLRSWHALLPGPQEDGGPGGPVRKPLPCAGPAQASRDRRRPYAAYTRQPTPRNPANWAQAAHPVSYIR